jgi:hypothetical protein
VPRNTDYENPKRTVEEKRTLISMLFSTPKTDNGKIEISYQKPFDMIHNRLQKLMTLEKTKKRTFEPPKKPTNKGKSTAFGNTCPVMLPLLDTFRILDWGQIKEEMKGLSFA